jgi:hypothetical protein
MAAKMEEDLEQVVTLAAVILAGAEEVCILRAKHRKQSWPYFCRPQLLPNPRVNTPWQVLHTSHSDCAFIMTMGFNVDTFTYILDTGFTNMWYLIPIVHVSNGLWVS